MAYEIYRDGVLIGRLHLEDILAIHGNKISAICDISGKVTVRGDK